MQKRKFQVKRKILGENHIQDDVKHLYLRLEGWHVKQLDVDRIG